MILVDTSIWIGYLRKENRPKIQRFEEILERAFPFGITSMIFQELLQGAGSDADYSRLKQYLGSQRIYQPIDSLASYAAAAQIYRRCRQQGITIRSTVDCLIAQVAIEHDLILLHDDRDFDNMRAAVPELSVY